jgi:RNA polymerase sigma-70 factor (sigma-E family)
MDDEALAAAEAFCRREHPRLVRFLELQCRDRSIAEDLAQVALARAWAHWDHVGRLEAPDQWARRVALNLATSWWRRRRVATRAHPRVHVRDNPLPEADEVLLDAIGSLTPRERAVVLLRFYEDQSVSDTAVVLGCAEGTVKALTARALERLRGLDLGIDEDG